MADPTSNLNIKQTDPTLADLLDLFQKQILLSLKCHDIGTIQGFDPDTQQVSVTINYKKTYSQRQPDGTYTSVLKNYPVLLNVPVIILTGGDACLTFPIEAGDTCLILYNDRDIDNWIQTGAVKGLASNRLHGIADGVALIGLRSLANALTDYDQERAVLRKGTAMVGVGKDDLVKIANEVTTLKTVLDGLIDVIKAIGTVGSSSAQTVNPASQSALDAQKTVIAGLLE